MIFLIQFSINYFGLKLGRVLFWNRFWVLFWNRKEDLIAIRKLHEKRHCLKPTLAFLNLVFDVINYFETKSALNEFKKIKWWFNYIVLPAISKAAIRHSWYLKFSFATQRNLHWNRYQSSPPINDLWLNNLLNVLQFFMRRMLQL